MTAQIIQFKPRSDLTRQYTLIMLESIALHRATIAFLNEILRVRYALWVEMVDPPTTE